MQICVNGQSPEIDAKAEMPLLWVLCDILGVTGTEYGRGMAQCGTCMVQSDGQGAPSCQVGLGVVAGDVTTIVDLGTLERSVQQPWIGHQAGQCGCCLSGRIIAAALLARNPGPTDARAQLSGGMLSGLGHAMNCEPTHRGHVPEQTDFQDDHVLRLDRSPEIAGRLWKNGPLRGLGKPGEPRAAPALGNTILAAIGQRIRSLLFSHHLSFA